MTKDIDILRKCRTNPDWAAYEINGLRLRFESAQANYLEVCETLGKAQARITILIDALKRGDDSALSALEDYEAGQ